MPALCRFHDSGNAEPSPGPIGRQRESVAVQDCMVLDLSTPTASPFRRFRRPRRDGGRHRRAEGQPRRDGRANAYAPQCEKPVLPAGLPYHSLRDGRAGIRVRAPWPPVSGRHPHPEAQEACAYWDITSPVADIVRRQYKQGTCARPDTTRCMTYHASDMSGGMAAEGFVVHRVISEWGRGSRVPRCEKRPKNANRNKERIPA
jgi:hypothetical protein